MPTFDLISPTYSPGFRINLALFFSFQKHKSKKCVKKKMGLCGESAYTSISPNVRRRVAANNSAIFAVIAILGYFRLTPHHNVHVVARQPPHEQQLCAYFPFVHPSFLRQWVFLDHELRDFCEENPELFRK